MTATRSKKLSRSASTVSAWIWKTVSPLIRRRTARTTIAAALQELDFGSSEKLARINAVGSGLENEDIQAVVAYRPDGIVIPKMEELAQIQWASDILEAAELKHGWPVGSIRLLVDVETARGILDLKEIASHPRLDALIFGGEDFAASVSATRTPEAVELLYAREATVVAAAAFSLQAIDIVTIDFKDLETLRLESEFGALAGFHRQADYSSRPGRPGAGSFYDPTMPQSPTPSASWKPSKPARPKVPEPTHWTAR